MQRAIGSGICVYGDVCACMGVCVCVIMCVRVYVYVYMCLCNYVRVVGRVWMGDQEH